MAGCDAVKNSKGYIERKVSLHRCLPIVKPQSNQRIGHFEMIKFLLIEKLVLVTYLADVSIGCSSPPTTGLV